MSRPLSMLLQDDYPSVLRDLPWLLSSVNDLERKIAKAEEALEAWESFDNAPQEDFDTSDGVGYETQEYARTLTRAALRGEEGKT